MRRSGRSQIILLMSKTIEAQIQQDRATRRARVAVGDSASEIASLAARWQASNGADLDIMERALNEAKDLAERRSVLLDERQQALLDIHKALGNYEDQSSMAEKIGKLKADLQEHGSLADALDVALRSLQRQVSDALGTSCLVKDPGLGPLPWDGRERLEEVKTLLQRLAQQGPHDQGKLSQDPLAAARERLGHLDWAALAMPCLRHLASMLADVIGPIEAPGLDRARAAASLSASQAT